MSSIPEIDIKKLWGGSAGRCAWCNKDLLLESKNAVQGDMAHIIAKKEKGPRGSSENPSCDRNTYENLILLCPNHHRQIDTNPEEYTVQQILNKKKAHEDVIRSRLEGQLFESISQLFTHCLKKLDENKVILEQLGPNSPIAQKNPGSTAKDLWDVRKVARIIPNNSEIISTFEKNTALLTATQSLVFSKYREHAIALEMNSYNRSDKEAAPPFPVEFRKMLEGVLTMNGENDDQPKDSEISYFRNILSSHDKIQNYSETKQQFQIQRKQNLKDVAVYLTGLYTIGIVDCMDITEQHPNINCIVTSSTWNSYTDEAKEYAISKEIGLFDVKEFMGALNKDDFWTYIKKNNR